MKRNRDDVLELLASRLGPHAFNRLVESVELTRQKGRLRFWQEELLKQASSEIGVGIRTVEQFTELFQGAKPREIPVNREAFLADPSGHWYYWQSNRRDKIPVEWFAEAWRTIPVFRENLSYELKRYTSKWGAMQAPEMLAMLNQFLVSTEVIALYEYIRDESGREEEEWRAEFEAAFPEHAPSLPAVRGTEAQ